MINFPRNRYRFVERRGDTYVWQRNVPGDSRVEEVSCKIDYFFEPAHNTTLIQDRCTYCGVLVQRAPEGWPGSARWWAVRVEEALCDEGPNSSHDVFTVDDLTCKPGCVRGDGHDGDCFDAEDIVEERLRSRDYSRWADL